MPAEGLDESRRNVLLPVVVADRFAKIASLVSEKETFVRIQIQPVSANPGIDGVEQRLGSRRGREQRPAPPDRLILPLPCAVL